MNAAVHPLIVSSGHPQWLADAAVVGGTAQWLAGLGTATRAGGVDAAVDYLLASASRGPLQAALSTPQGRAALIGGVVGFVWGTHNAVKIRATAAVLASIANDQSLTPSSKAQRVASALRAAVSSTKTQPTYRDAGISRQGQPLGISLGEARAALAETRALLRLNPDDADLKTIALGQGARVDALQRQWDAAPTRQPPSRPASIATTLDPAAAAQPTVPAPLPLPQKKLPAPATDGSVGQQRTAQQETARREQLTAHFMAELKGQSGIDYRDDISRVQELIDSTPPAALKQEAGAIRQLLKTPGWGNIYAHDDRAPTTVKKNRDFVQYNWHNVPLLGKDLKFIAASLERYGRGLDASSQASPTRASGNSQPGVRGNADVGAAAPASPATLHWTDRLPGQSQRIDLWADPATGTLCMSDPHDARSIHLAAEIEPPSTGGKPTRTGGAINIFVQQIFPGGSGGATPPGGGKKPKGPWRPRPPALATLATFAVPMLYFWHAGAEQSTGVKVDTVSPKRRNEQLIASGVDKQTSRQALGGVRQQIWGNYLDSAMTSLRSARQGGALAFLPRFSDDELAQLQKQVDAFKAQLATAPALAASDAQQPTLRFDFNPTSDYNKKTEAITLAFGLVNQFANADTKALAQKVFGRADGVGAISRFDVSALVARNPALKDGAAAGAKALSSAEQQIWTHYLSQAPGLMAWPPDGGQAKAYAAALGQWLHNRANFERDGSPLATAQIGFEPPLLLEETTSRQLGQQIKALAEQARQDINGLRVQVPVAATGGIAPSIVAQVRSDLDQQEQQAHAVGAPFRRQLDAQAKRLAERAPGDALPAVDDLPPGDGPIARPKAEALRAQLAATDARLLDVDKALTSLRNELASASQRQHGAARTELSELQGLVDARLKVVRDLRTSLRDRAVELQRRPEPNAVQVPGGGAASTPQPKPDILPVPLPTVPSSPTWVLPDVEPTPVVSPTLSDEGGAPGRKVTPQPVPQATPVPGITPMPLPPDAPN